MHSWKINVSGGLRVGRRVGWTVLAFLSLFAGLASAAEPETVKFNDWTRELDRVLSTGGMTGAEVSALVIRERDGKVLYARQPDRLMTPASNAKILTALAALDTFGAAHQFETQVSTDGTLGRDGMAQTLYVRGGGDPAVTSEDYWRFASELRDAGLRGVKGDLVVDDSLFDRVRWHPTVKGVSPRAYHAPVGALNANYGSFSVTIRPGSEVGAPVSVTISPPVSYLVPSNHGTTLSKSVRRTIVVDRKGGDGVERVSIHGGMRLGDKPKTFYRSVLQPDLYAAAVIRMQLAALGIDVKGRIRSGAAPDSARPLHTFAGSPLADIVRSFMKFSNNGIAEALVKNLAIHSGSSIGTWELGGLAMRDRLIGLGVPADGFDLVDGSGLSYQDRVSPRALVTALRVARNQFQSSPEFMSSLPVAGRDGTLKKRAKNARDQVRAKTGLLNGITGLSGYAAMPAPGRSGEREVVVFSVLANGYRKSDKEAIKSLDAFVSKLVAVDERRN